MTNDTPHLERTMNAMHTVFAAALLSVAGTALSATAASSYPSFQYFGSETNLGTPWLRGNFNNWGKTPMVAFNAFENISVTYGAYVNVPAGTETYKFDTSAAGDWSTNYGNNNLAADCLTLNGNNIPLTQGAGTYTIVYETNPTGGAYGCKSSAYTVTLLNTFTANYRTMFLRSSFSNWSLLPMYLVKNNVWEAPVNAPVNTAGYMKFDNNGDWATSFGIPVGSNPQLSIDMGTAVKGGSNIGLYVQDYSGATQIPAVIRFNDQTLQYSYCPVNEPVSFNTALCQ